MNVQLVGRRISQAYAVAVLLLGVLLISLAGFLFQAVHVGHDIATVTLPPGLVLVGLSPFIWRGMIWASFAVFALSLLYVLIALNFNLQDPQSGWLLVIPALFGTLSVAHIVATLKAKPRASVTDKSSKATADSRRPPRPE